MALNIASSYSFLDFSSTMVSFYKIIQIYRLYTVQYKKRNLPKGPHHFTYIGPDLSVPRD